VSDSLRPQAQPILEIERLHAWFSTPRGVLRAVDDVSLTLATGETLGVVGESGSGKSVLMRSVMRLLPETASHPEGRIAFDGRDLLAMRPAEQRAIFGPEIAMVFQDSLSALNPVVRVGRQITESMTAHLKVDRAAARQRAIELLRQVGIAEPERRLRAYPGELSGGMRQRACDRSSTSSAMCSALPAWRWCSSPTTSASSLGEPTALP
jgi:peptide/nickel transport system ATP-binding protein